MQLILCLSDKNNCDIYFMELCTSVIMPYEYVHLNMYAFNDEDNI